MRITALQTIFDLAKKNKKIVFIGSDLGPGVMENFKKKFPERFFMEGVSEQFIIGMAAGLAKNGYIPFVNTISTFLTRRCLDQIIIDLCLHKLPVRLIGNGGGLVYAPLGPTHLAIEDIAILRPIPNIMILCPCDANEMKQLILLTEKIENPVYFRVARGGEKIITKEKIKRIGDPILYKQSNNLVFLTTGITAQIAQEAIVELKKKNINAGHVHLSSIKPYSKSKLFNLLKNTRKLVTLEEHTLIGGLGSLIANFLFETKLNKKIDLMKFGISDIFSEKYGEQKDLLDYAGLSCQNIVNKSIKFYKS